MVGLVAEVMTPLLNGLTETKKATPLSLFHQRTTAKDEQLRFRTKPK